MHESNEINGTYGLSIVVLLSQMRDIIINLMLELLLVSTKCQEAYWESYISKYKRSLQILEVQYTAQTTTKLKQLNR